MSDLPAGLAEPLHILDPLPWRALALWALLILLAGAWLLYRRFRRRSTTVPPPPPGTPPPAADGASVSDLREHYGRLRDYRGGCHALASHMRARAGEKSGRRLATLTADEIALAVKDAGVVSVFELLAELQFRRREPSSHDFYGICDLAALALRERGTRA